jgi:hypothetical protein
VGLFMVVFSLLALSGPGRIDIVDGQARFEVAKSIALHGDAVVRNPAVWFSVFPGRGGQPFSYYRLPHSVLGALSILLSDLTGPDIDPRRHFWFVLVSAVAAAALACVYFWWFRRIGLRHGQALAWAIAGIVCTPAWYYGTSTFDDILAAVAVSTAVAFSLAIRPLRGLRWSLLSGLTFGLAFAVKEPLGAFALVGLCALDRQTDPTAHRVKRAFIFVSGLLLGIALYVAFELYKFPPGTKAAHEALLEVYVRPFPGHFVWGLLALGLSPCAGFVWYAPSAVLSLAGVSRAFPGDHRITRAFVASCAIFFGFIAAISFCKGDPAWGPRYLTPLYAVLWLAAPAGAARFRRGARVLLLSLGVGVQLLALSADPSTIHLRRGFSPALSAYYPIVHFDWRNAQLIDRPGELVDIWRARRDPGKAFSWSDPPTSQEDLLPWSQDGASVISHYKLLSSFRPWWVSYRYVPPDERPVSIGRTAVAFLGTFCLGAVFLAAGLRYCNRTRQEHMAGRALENHDCLRRDLSVRRGRDAAEELGDRSSAGAART